MTKSALGGDMPVSVVGRGSRAVVFIHGFLDAGAIWNDVVAALDPRLDVTSVTLDLAGMGAFGDVDGPYSLERYANDVAALVAKLDCPTVLVGQSMGAQIAELVARAHPEIVRALVLLAPVPLAGIHAPPTVVDSFKALAGDPDAQRKVRVQLSCALENDARERLVQLGVPVRSEVVSALVDAWNEGHPAGHERSAFTGPALVVRAATDGFVDAAMADAVAARFVDVQRVTVERAGHWAHVERAEEISARISEILGETLGWWSSEADAPGGTPAHDWRQAFARKSPTAFVDAFAEDIELEASVLVKPVVGRALVGTVMETASAIYEQLEFGDQSASGRKQYLEWRARANGVELRGITVITRDERGAIRHVAIHHRPLEGALMFSFELGKRLREVLDGSYFYSGERPHSAEGAAQP